MGGWAMEPASASALESLSWWSLLFSSSRTQLVAVKDDLFNSLRRPSRWHIRTTNRRPTTIKGITMDLPQQVHIVRQVQGRPMARLRELLLLTTMQHSTRHRRGPLPRRTCRERRGKTLRPTSMFRTRWLERLEPSAQQRCGPPDDAQSQTANLLFESFYSTRVQL